MREYYEQRASDGGLIISEATNISLTSRGWLGAPGLYSDQQVKGWKEVVSAVHAKGGHMFAQLWHTGRSSHVAMTGGATPVVIVTGHLSDHIFRLVEISFRGFNPTRPLVL